MTAGKWKQPKWTSTDEESGISMQQNVLQQEQGMSYRHMHNVRELCKH